MSRSGGGCGEGNFKSEKKKLGGGGEKIKFQKKFEIRGKKETGKGAGRK